MYRLTGSNVNVTFASAQKGSELITAKDDYLARISPFDRQSKIRTNTVMSQDDLIRFYAENTLEWTPAEQEKIATAVELFRELSADLSLPLPEEVLFVKTTGKEEGGAAYTRANAIFFPERFIAIPQEKLNWWVCHEFFHVLTRANPDLREQLYQIIGFEKCGEIELPPELEARKISNPDAPIYDHVIRLQVDGKDHWGVPIIYSEEDFDADAGKTFFGYLTFKLLLAEKKPDLPVDVKATFNNNSSKLYGPNEVHGFFEQVGRNTDYLIHPEEILAENFVHMLMQNKGLKDPQITAKMRQTLLSYNTSPKGRNPDIFEQRR